MPKKITETFQCDLCGTETRSDEKKESWIHFSQDDNYEERKWHERYLCPSCVEEILTAIRKSKEK